MDEYRNYCGTANTIGVPFELIGPNEIGDLWPLCNLDGLVGALFHPDDGHVVPVDVTQALAKGARDRGAEIYRNTEVTGIERTRANGEWVVKTDAGRNQVRNGGDGHGLLGAAGGRHGGSRPPDNPGGAPVHRDRHHPGAGGAQGAGPARDAGAARE